MAQQKRIVYDIDFQVKDTGLKAVQKELKQISNMSTLDLSKMTGQTNTNKLKRQLNQAKKAAKDTEVALKAAYNPKLNTYNIDTFKSVIKQTYGNVDVLRSKLLQAGPAGERAFNSAMHSVTKFNTEVKQSHTLLNKLGTTLANTIKWNISSSLMNGVTQSIQQAWGFAKNLDSSLNDIRIVTGKSADEMARFAERANAVASNLGKGTTDYTRAALIYAQQGLGDKEVTARTDVTLKAANVTGQSAEAVSEELTAVWNGYKASAEEAEIYVDRLAAIASTTASNLQELSTGMSKVAAAAASLGVGEEQLAAQISTIISATRQAPETVGTALKTVYARITDIKAGIDEDGTTLGEYSGKLAEMGINVLDAAGNLRNMGTVMEEIGEKWQNLTKEQQIYVAQTMAGQRQYSNLISLFDNFDKYEKAVQTANNAEGTLQKQQDTRMESLGAHLQKMTTATEKMWMGLTDNDGIKDTIDSLTTIIEKVDNLFQAIGGGKAVLNSVGTIAMSLLTGPMAKGLSTTISNIQLIQKQKAENQSKIDFTQETAAYLRGKGKEEEAQVWDQKTEFFKKSQGTFTTEQMQAINKHWTAAESAANQHSEAQERLSLINSKANLVGTGATDAEKRQNAQAYYENMTNAFENENINLQMPEGNSEEIKNFTDQIKAAQEAIKAAQAEKEKLLGQQAANEKITGEKDAYAKYISDKQDEIAYHKESIEGNKKSIQQMKNRQEISWGQGESFNIFKNVGQDADDNLKALSSKYKQLQTDIQTMNENGVDTTSDEYRKLTDRIESFMGEAADYAQRSSQEMSDGYKDAAEDERVSAEALKNAKVAAEQQAQAAVRKERIQGAMQFISGLSMMQVSVQNLGNAFKNALDTGDWMSFVGAVLASAPMLISSFTQITSGFSKIEPLLNKQLIAKKADTAESIKNAAANTTQAAAQTAAAGAAQAEARAQERATAAQTAEMRTSATNAAANTTQAAAQTATAGTSAAGAAGGFKALAASIGLTSTAMIGLTAAVAATIAIFAIVKIAIDSRNKQAQQTIKLMEEQIEKEKEVQETISHEKDIIAEVKKLNDEYKNGIITRQELKQKTAELQEKYTDESDTIKNLISDYTKLNEAIQKASDANDRAQLESDKKMALYKATIARNTDEGAVKGNEWWRLGSVSQMQAQAIGKTVLQVGVGETGFGSKLATSLSARGVGNGKGEQENIALLGSILGPVGKVIGTAAGAELGKNSLTHVDINDIQTKSQLKDVVAGLKQALDSASQEDLDTAIYQETVQQYNSLSDQLKEWQAADLAVLHDIAHNTAKAVSKNFNFVDSFDEYQKAYSDSTAQMYEKLSNSNQKYGEDDDAKTFNELTADEQWDIISSELEKVIPQDLKTEYGDRMDALNLYNHLYGNGYFKSGKENDLSMVAMVEGLNEDQLKIWDSYLDDAIQANLTTKQINETLDYIANHDFSKLTFNEAEAEKAAQTYNNMANALEKIQNGKGISKKDFETYGFENDNELKDLFRFGNSGYVLKDLADQKKVEELIKQKQRSGWDAKYLANEQKEKDRQQWINSGAGQYQLQTFQNLTKTSAISLTDTDAFKKYENSAIKKYENSANYNNRKEFTKYLAEELAKSGQGSFQSNYNYYDAIFDNLYTGQSNEQYMKDIKKYIEDNNINLIKTENVKNAQSTNNQNAQQMIEHLERFATDSQTQVKLQKYKDQIANNNGQVTETVYNDIYDLYQKLQSTYKNAEKDAKEAAEAQKEALQNIHDSIFPIDKDIDETIVAQLGEQFQLTAQKSELLDDALKDNAKQAREVAEQVQRYDAALKSVIKNYGNWSNALQNGSTAEKLAVMPQIKNSMADTLGISDNVISNSFATTTENLENMRKALQGDKQAYKALQAAMYEDIIAHVGLDDKDLIAAKGLIEHVFDDVNLDDIEVGATLDDAQVQKVLARLIEMGIDSAETLEAIFATYYDVDLDVDIIDGKAQILSLTKAATHELKQQKKSAEELRKAERDRIKSQQRMTEYLRDNRDLYHQINILLKDQERTISRITKNQSEMYGTELIDNLNAESRELSKQNKLYQQKQKMAKQYAAQKRSQLTQYGATFDQNGNISNYNQLKANSINRQNALIGQENGLKQAMNAYLLNGGNTSDEQYQEWQLQQTQISNQLQDAKQDQTKLDELLSGYESDKQIIEEMTDKLTEAAQRQIEIKLQKFDMKVKISLDLSQAQKTWNDYKRNVLQHDNILNPNKVISANKDNVQKLADINSDSTALSQVNSNIQDILNGKVEFKTQGQKKAKLEEYQKQAIEIRKRILETEDAIKQTYLDQYSIIGETFEKQKSQYEFINNQLEHNKNLMKLIYGEEDYATQNLYNDKMIQNNLQSIESMNNRIKLAESNLQEAKKSGNTAVIEAAEAEWQTAIQNRNQLEEQSIQLIKDRYITAINQISHQMEMKLTNNKGFSYLDTEWDLLKKKSNLYLDDINSAFAIKDVQYNYTQALNDTKGLKSQQQLKKVMNEQLSILKEKDKLTQYDVDRAGKVLEIEKARIALEQARNNKTQMRLKRDSQGNYSYQYVADQDKIAEAEQKLNKAENDLYNFDKENYQKNLEEAYNATKEYHEKVAALQEEWGNATIERRAQIEEELKLLEKEYSDYVISLTGETEWTKQNLMDSAMQAAIGTMDEQRTAFENMSDAQKQKWLGDMVPAINSGIGEMIGKFSENPDSFKNIVVEATKAMDEKRQEYQSGLSELEKAAGQNYTNIKKGIDEVEASEKTLIEDNDTLLKQAKAIVDEMSKTITALNNQKNAWQNVYDTTDSAVKRVYDYITAVNKAALHSLNNDNSGGGTGGDTTTTTPNPGTLNATEAILPSSGINGGNNNPLESNSTKTSKGNSTKTSKGNSTNNVNTNILIKGLKELRKYGGWNWEEVLPSYNKSIITRDFYGKLRARLTNMELPADDKIFEQTKNLIYNSSLKHMNTMEITNKIRKNPTKELDRTNYNSSGYLILLHEALGGKAFFTELNKLRQAVFDTGGYTGDWDSSEGRMAILHEKELVLNKQDTANLLDTIQALRDIYTMNTIQSQITSMLESLNEQAKVQKERIETLKQQRSLQQQVSISASFPSVTNKNEIEAAFNELINKATQATLKNKR